MLMILARLVRSESFWAVAKVRSPHTGPEFGYPRLSGQALEAEEMRLMRLREGASLPAPQDACHGHAPRGEEGGQACSGGGAQGDCA